MKQWRTLAAAAIACACFFALGAAATRIVYVGTFVGNGAALTNATGIAYSSVGTAGLSNASAFQLRTTTLLNLATNNGAALTNLPATSLSSAVLIRLSTNNATGLTNITASSTNADTATIATWVTGNGDALTNQVGAQAYLTVNGASDGVSAAVRGFSAQTLNIFEVQTSGSNPLFGIGYQGAVFLATNGVAAWPTGATTFGGAAFVNSNSTVFLLTTTPNSKVWALTNKIAGP